MKKYMRHKWILDDNGNKKCEKCESRINLNKIGFPRYYEGGCTMDYVNWYPRCKPLIPTN